MSFRLRLTMDYFCIHTLGYPNVGKINLKWMEIYSLAGEYLPSMHKALVNAQQGQTCLLSRLIISCLTVPVYTWF